MLRAVRIRFLLSFLFYFSLLIWFERILTGALYAFIYVFDLYVSAYDSGARLLVREDAYLLAQCLLFSIIYGFHEWNGNGNNNEFEYARVVSLALLLQHCSSVYNFEDNKLYLWLCGDVFFSFSLPPPEHVFKIVLISPLNRLYAIWFAFVLFFKVLPRICFSSILSLVLSRRL